MRNIAGLLAAAALGVVATIGVEAGGQAANHGCTGASDLSQLNKRFDDLEQALAALQAQSAKAESDDALASANNQRQLANILSQVDSLNETVVALSGRLSTLPPRSR